MDSENSDLNLRLSPELNSALEVHSQKAQLSSKTDLIIDALALYFTVSDNKSDGDRLAIVDKKNQVKTEIIGM